MTYTSTQDKNITNVAGYGSVMGGQQSGERHIAFHSLGNGFYPVLTCFMFDLNVEHMRDDTAGEGQSGSVSIGLTISRRDNVVTDRKKLSSFEHCMANVLSFTPKTDDVQLEIKRFNSLFDDCNPTFFRFVDNLTCHFTRSIFDRLAGTSHGVKTYEMACEKTKNLMWESLANNSEFRSLHDMYFKSYGSVSAESIIEEISKGESSDYVVIDSFSDCSSDLRMKIIDRAVNIGKGFIRGLSDLCLSLSLNNAFTQVLGQIVGRVLSSKMSLDNLAPTGSFCTGRTGVAEVLTYPSNFYFPEGEECSDCPPIYVNGAAYLLTNQPSWTVCYPVVSSLFNGTSAYDMHAFKKDDSGVITFGLSILNRLKPGSFNIIYMSLIDVSICMALLDVSECIKRSEVRGSVTFYGMRRPMLIPGEVLELSSASYFGNRMIPVTTCLFMEFVIFMYKRIIVDLDLTEFNKFHNTKTLSKSTLWVSFTCMYNSFCWETSKARKSYKSKADHGTEHLNRSVYGFEYHDMFSCMITKPVFIFGDVE